jgi:cephalosporin-C deacetylase
MNYLLPTIVFASMALTWNVFSWGDELANLPIIPEQWKFQVGDDPTWSEARLDDEAWQTIEVGKNWESQGHEDYDGYAWYRVALHIPKSMESNAALLELGHLTLTLGKIDDVEQVWFNGASIGQTGQFPPSYSTAWTQSRRYTIPANLVRWDAENVIAVRVFDEGGDGGLYEGPYKLDVADWSDFLKLEIDKIGQDGTVRTLDVPPLGVTLRNSSDAAISGELSWAVEDDEGTQLTSGTVVAKIPAGGDERIELAFSTPKSDVYRIRYEFTAVDGGEPVSAARTFAYRPQEIQAALTKQADIDEFWQETLAALNDVDPQFRLTRAPERDSKTHQVFEVELRSLGGVRVRGWYETPIAEGKHPALLRVPGYGSNMQPSGMHHPIAVFSFNPRGHGNSQDDVSGTPRDYWLRGLDDKEGYFYQGAYADCVRAVDFLASRPEVDSSRIGVTGGSQGGGLSLATAALDPRIIACAPDIPFLCDWVNYFKTSDWPEMQDWIDAEPHRSWEQTLKTLSYFDMLNLADRIKCPVFVGMGMQDEICPAGTIFAVYNRLPGGKEFRVYPDAKHWVPDRHYQLKIDWFNSQFQKAQSEKSASNE